MEAWKQVDAGGAGGRGGGGGHALGGGGPHPDAEMEAWEQLLAAAAEADAGGAGGGRGGEGGHALGGGGGGKGRRAVSGWSQEELQERRNAQQDRQVRLG
jgi:hypothetical protein